MGQGKVLKNLRQKKNMSQDEVAKSIVSKSYLSRIENDKIEANEETLALLFERVGVDYYDRKTDHTKINRLLKDWECPLLHNDREASSAVFREIYPLLTDMTSLPLQLEYHIKAIRHFIIDQDLPQAEASVQFSERFAESLNSRLRFLFHKHIGNYYWQTGEPDHAEYHFDRGLREFSGIHFHDLEKADLHFLYGLVLYSLRKESLCFYNAEEALRIFQSHYRPKQCMKVHIQLGICHSRIGDFPTCLSHYEKAEGLAEFLEEPMYLGIIKHNYANMYVRMKDYDKAITHLDEAMKRKQKDSGSFAQSLVLLLEVYYDQKEFAKCQKLINEYNYLTGSLSDNLTSVQELKFFCSFLTLPKEEWETFMEKEFFHKLEKNRDSRKIMKYAKILAEFYETRGYYKRASQYYRLALINSEDVLGFR